MSTQRARDADALLRAMRACEARTRDDDERANATTTTNDDDGDDGGARVVESVDDEGVRANGDTKESGVRERDEQRTRATSPAATIATASEDDLEARCSAGASESGRTELERASAMKSDVAVSDEDVAALEAYLQSGFGLVHADGVDAEGLPVVTVNATRIPGWAGSGDRDRSLKLLTKALVETAEKGDYNVVVYFGNDDRSRGVVPSGAVQWLREIHDSLSYPVRKNVKKIVFVNVPFFASYVISMMTPFLSSKAARKMVWAKSLADMDRATNSQLSVNHCGERFKRSVAYVSVSGAEVELQGVQQTATG